MSYTKNMKIGVFDSGIGGQSVALAIEETLPELVVIRASDSEHVPYGNKSIEEIYGYVLPILNSLVEQDCRVIVIACNTVTTTLINRLREHFDIPLIGIEPMIKPAAEQTDSDIIAVCATPATLSSARYQWLKKTYASGVKVLEPDCSNWPSMIESNQIDRQHVEKLINNVCLRGADVIVLGCTHYHWIEDIIRQATVGRAKVLQPERSIVERLKTIITQLS